MPTKQTKDGRSYEIDGKKFIWHPEDDEGNVGNVADIVIPLRIKLKLVRAMSGDELDNDSMFAMIEALIPNSAAALDEMDVNDFQAMFTTWQEEYNTVSGASLGESSPSTS